MLSCSSSTHFAYYDVNPVSEKEVSSPEKIDEGGPRDVGKYLRYHTDDEEKISGRFFIVILGKPHLCKNLTCSQ